MMVSAQVVGNDATICWANAVGSNFELNVMMPVLAYNLLQSISLLTEASKVFGSRCVTVDADVVVFGEVRGLEANTERCNALIEQSLAMCTALAPRIGYDAAAAVAKVASKTGRNVRDVVNDLVETPPGEYEGVLGVAASPDAQRIGPLRQDEVDQLLDPIRQTHRGTGG